MVGWILRLGVKIYRQGFIVLRKIKLNEVAKLRNLNSLVSYAQRPKLLDGELDAEPLGTSNSGVARCAFSV